MTNIFVSHATKDGELAKEMQDRLREAGFKPWIDRSARPGQDWRFEVDDAIKSAHAVIIVLTPNAAESVYVTYEWALALGLGKTVVPVVFKSVSVHPRLLSLNLYKKNAWRDENHFWDHFVREMRKNLLPQEGNQASPISPSDPKTIAQPVYNRNVMPTHKGNWLVIRRGPEVNKMFKLQGESILLGRDVNVDIVVNNHEVSRKHLRLTRQGVGYAVEDLDSLNGTSVNGHPLTYIRTLNPGDTLLLGDSIILSYEVVN